MSKHNDKVEKYFKSLDRKDYSGTYDKLPSIISSVRKGIANQPVEVKNEVYGTLAEQVAKVLLDMYATQHECRIMESTILEYEPGRTTEIDLIMITRNMVFIIECKHRSQDIIVTSEGNFLIGDREESPISQNIHHINKMLSTLTYGGLLGKKRVFNIVFLLFNNARMHNPITMFTKDSFHGGLAGYSNLLPLIHKINSEAEQGKVPMNTIYKDLVEKSSKYKGKEGMKQHIKNVTRGRAKA